MTRRARSFYQATLLMSTLLAAGALVRIWHLLDQAASLPLLFHPVMDARLYHDWARAIAGGESIAPGAYYHAPGYPQIVGFLYQLFSVHPVPVVVVQSLLGLGTTLLVFVLGRRLFGTAEGALAGLLFLGYAPVYFFEAKLLAVTLAVFLSTLVVFLAIHVEDRSRPNRVLFWARVVVLGLAAGLLAVVRANLALVFLLLLIVFAFKAWKGGVPRRVPLVFAAAAVLVVLPTTANNVLHGVWSPIATNGGFNFYSGNLRGAQGIYTDVAGISGVIRNQEAEADSLVVADLGHLLSPGEESRYWLRRGLREISFDPGGWFKLLGRKLWLLFHREENTVNGNLAMESDHILLYRVAKVPFNVVAVLGVVGLGLAGGWFRNRRTTERPLAPVYALLLSVLVSGVAFFVMTRLRLPAYPVLAVFAAHTLVLGWRAIQLRWWGRVAGVGAVAAVLCALTWVSPLSSPRNPAWESELFLQVGNASVQQGNSARAHQAYRLAEAADPKSLKPLRAQSQLAKDDGDLDLAIAALERAVNVDPEDLDIRINLGIAYFASGKLEDCVGTMEAASDLDPSTAVPHLYRGYALARLQRPEAGAALETALDRNPSMTSAYTALLDLLLRAGNPDSAAVWAARADARGVKIPDSIRARLR